MLPYLTVFSQDYCILFYYISLSMLIDKTPQNILFYLSIKKQRQLTHF